MYFDYNHSLPYYPILSFPPPLCILFFPQKVTHTFTHACTHANTPSLPLDRSHTHIYTLSLLTLIRVALLG